MYKSILFLALIILLISSWNAPISGDEYVHVAQSEKNIDYIESFGENKEALHTPISRLKHYGQSFDTITTWLIQVFLIENAYRFRHVSNAVMAWLTIVFASLITFQITRSRMASIVTVILFLISARFMGHAMNNLKDIPFAFAFVFSIYFIYRFIIELPKISWIDLGLLTVGIAFGISIRIGGLLIFAYLILFAGLYYYFLWVSGKIENGKKLKLGLKLGALFFVVFVLAYFSSMLIWPFALENPLKNPQESLELMHHYPTTIRQIFEGKLYWSDRFPWYYLFKYLLITLPALVLIGFAAYFVMARKLKSAQNIILSIFTLIAFGFPLFYASVSHANVYGGWRQMLFVFPPLVVLSSIGIWGIYESIKTNIYWKLAGIFVCIILIILPLKFTFTNYPYQYTFFNMLVGGTSGAYGNYELDYYFTSYKKAFEFIDEQVKDNPQIVASNFIIPEYYKGKPYKQKLIDYYNRSSADWDYAIICNTFLDPYQLRENYWPPSNAVYTVQVEGKPILAVLKRPTKLDLEGKRLLDKGDYQAAITMLNDALEIDPDNESILINLAFAYKLTNDFFNAEKSLDQLQVRYPDNEWAIDIKGEMNLNEGKVKEAIVLFERNIAYNYKFYHSYINLAKAYILKENTIEAEDVLVSCLRINPFYEPAYKLYGRILIDRGELELGEKMLQFSIKGSSKYGIQ